MKCHKKRFGKLGAKMALAKAQSAKASNRRNEKRMYYCGVCKAWHLSSQDRRAA